MELKTARRSNPYKWWCMCGVRECVRVCAREWCDCVDRQVDSNYIFSIQSYFMVAELVLATEWNDM